MPEAITAAIVAAVSAAALACISRSRCRFLVTQNGTSFGVGFSEVPLPLPSPTSLEKNEKAHKTCAFWSYSAERAA